MTRRQMSVCDVQTRCKLQINTDKEQANRKPAGVETTVGATTNLPAKSSTAVGWRHRGSPCIVFKSSRLAPKRPLVWWKTSGPCRTKGREQLPQHQDILRILISVWLVLLSDRCWIDTLLACPHPLRWPSRAQRSPHLHATDTMFVV